MHKMEYVNLALKIVSNAQVEINVKFVKKDMPVIKDNVLAVVQMDTSY